jgi:HAMP domain-containing protein
VTLLATLLKRLPLSSIRNRILVIALLPALLTEFGLVAYFTTQALASAESALHVRAANAARHLAGALQYSLISGDTARVYALLETEMTNSQLAMARVIDPQGKILAGIGNGPSADMPDAPYRQHATIRLPAAAPIDDVPLHPGIQPASDVLGQIEVGVALDQIKAFKRDTLFHAALLMLVALAITGVLAWRLSNRLAGQLRHIGRVVHRLTGADLSVRTELPPQGEVGALAAGVNDMAEALQTHRSELEERIREATAGLAAKMDMAERANQAKSRFFAAASHDLRQPLHALSLFVAALKARNQQPETQTLIDNIEASTAAMELLFNALLDISRLDAGAIEPHPVHFPLQKMLRDLDQQFGALAEEKGLRLRFRPCNITLYRYPLLM